MALETVTYIGDLNSANPLGTDPKSQGDDHQRMIKLSLRNCFAGFAGAVLITGVDGGAANVYTLTPLNALPAYTAKTLYLLSPTVNNTGAVTYNVSSLGARAVTSVTGAALVAGDFQVGSKYLACDTGSEMRLIAVTKNYVDQAVVAGTIPAQALGFYRSDGTVSAFTQTHTGYAQKEVKGADIASAATINLTTATGNLVHVTGTTTVTAITIPVGAQYTIIFDGILTLTHGAALLLPGAANIVTAANDRMVVRGDTAGAIVISYTRANALPIAANPYFWARDEKASGSDAGTNTANDITQTRTINVVKANTVPGASLASNQITLPAGTYQVAARVPAFNTQNSKAFLYNVTDSAYLITGSNAILGNVMYAESNIKGTFTITGTKNISIRHYTMSSNPGNGLGAAVIITGQVEVYTEIELWKVA